MKWRTGDEREKAAASTQRDSDAVSGTSCTRVMGRDARVRGRAGDKGSGALLVVGLALWRDTIEVAMM